MCKKIKEEGKMKIIFDDDTNVINNDIGFIDSMADLLRVGGYVPDRYKNVIIPMLIITRLDYILVDTHEEVKNQVEELKELGEELSESEMDGLFTGITGKSFYNIAPFTLKGVLEEAKLIKDNFEEYLNGFSSNVKMILNSFKFFDEVTELKKKDILFNVIENFYNKKEVFDPKNVDDLRMGNMFEGIIRKYYANPTAGQYFTPREIIRLMVNLLIADFDANQDLLEPQTQVNILDMACGTGGMLSIAEDSLMQINEDLRISLFGQEFSEELHSVCVSDMLIKGHDANNIAYTNTLTTDKFPEKKMRFVIANPPFGTQWKPSAGKNKNEDEKKANALLANQLEAIQKEVEKREHGKYEAGIPSDGTDCQLLFMQHALYKLADDGKAAIITNGKPLFSGDITSGESAIRKWIIDKDYLEAIIGLPGNMFYNTSINIYIHILSKNKTNKRKGKIQLINAQDENDKFNFHRKARKSIGDKRNELTKEHIEKIVDLYISFKDSEDGYSKIINKEDFLLKRIITKQAFQCDFCVNDERLESFKDGKIFHSLIHGGQSGAYGKLKLSLQKKEKGLKLEDKEIKDIEKYNIGLDMFGKIYNAISKVKSEKIYYNIDEFTELIKSALGIYKKGASWVISEIDDIKFADIKKTTFNNDSFDDFFKKLALDFSVHNEEADIIRDKDGNMVFNDETKDTETMPNLQDIQEYLDKEVLPYAKNTYMVGNILDDTEKNPDIIRGAEFSFTKQFYKYEPLEDSSVLIERFQKLEDELSLDIAELMRED